MLVSIIIPIKNGGTLLQKVLYTIQDQKTNFSFELILVDSGSSDGTYEFLETFKNNFDNVTIFQIEPKEFGHGKTRNFATSLANGEYYVFLTQDALPANENWLQHLIDGFNNDDEIGAVFGKHLPYDSALPVEKYTIINHFDKFIGDAWQKIKIEDREHFNQHVGWYIFFSNNNSAIRKEIFNEIKFSEVEMSEDQNFAKDMLLKGYAKAYANNSIVYHSHRYSNREIFKRFFDEYRSYNLLGVEKEATLYEFFKFYIVQYGRSLFIINNTVKGLFYKLYWGIYYLFYDFSKALGFYLGTNSKRFNIYNYFSMQEENKKT